MLKYGILYTDYPYNFGKTKYFSPCKELVTGWRKEETYAIQLLAGDRMTLLSKAYAQAAGRTHSPIQWVSQPLYSRLKRPWREVDHSPPSVEIHLHDHA
jgi:hypothetical protein